ncbi:Acetyltransferase (GNAT) family [Geosmithia morbida]|uniref:Acetyltransferase (GNAT) family n=1 Tax=Geosmithia morbida TaxID=1094350 RepID=A0A9P4YQ90_9HYPO|nr:Acetyltransferase (GNAT) family [Geosmithia morbida]KAF4119636.1 Acetyltransferase (GNAT) family [Geosmithia morbida]
MDEGQDQMSEAGLRPSAGVSATLLWDRQNCVPLSRCLSEDGMILLLTPVVTPPASTTAASGVAIDPFEPLGRALSQRYPMVRHVPYTKNGGITGAHLAFIRKADVILFVVTGFPTAGEETSQPDLADAVNGARDPQPLIVVLCCDVEVPRIREFDFQTVVQTIGFDVCSLQAISGLLLDGQSGKSSDSGSGRGGSGEHQSTTTPTGQQWPIRPFDYDLDLEELHSLWTENTPRKWHLDMATLGSLLRRDGYAMHHVVRDPLSGGVIGFCATYATFANGKGEKLIGSMAAVIVKAEFRRKGVGRALHDAGLGSLTRIRGMHRVQLGTTFPRLLYGIPADHPNLAWFQSRGWTLDQQGPGMGRPMADWLLRFADTPPPMELASAGLSFRWCEVGDSAMVLDMAARESERKNTFGCWYDQYARALDGDSMGDIVVGFEGTTMVASAITYIPSRGGPMSHDIPWAASIGPDIGGISCICIKGETRTYPLSLSAYGIYQTGPPPFC